MAAPWFKLYAAEFLSDTKVRVLSREHRSMLVDLWCYCSQDGSVPADIEDLSRLLGESIATMRKAMPRLLPFFVQEGDRLVSLRMRSEADAYESKCERLRANGSKGGRPKKADAKPEAKPNGFPNGSAIEKQMPPEGEREEEKNNPPTPLAAAKGERKSRKEAKAERLAPYREDVVQMVSRLAALWPTRRNDRERSLVRTDEVDACSAVETILRERPEVTLEMLEQAAMDWLSIPQDYPNAMQFWFGPGKKDGPEAPWKKAVRALMPRPQVMPLVREA